MFQKPVLFLTCESAGRQTVPPAPDLFMRGEPAVPLLGPQFSPELDAKPSHMEGGVKVEEPTFRLDSRQRMCRVPLVSEGSPQCRGPSLLSHPACLTALAGF